MIEIAVQVNGKVRDTIQIPIDADQKVVEEMAFKSQKVLSFTDGKKIVKVIYVKGRICNIVVK